MTSDSENMVILKIDEETCTASGFQKAIITVPVTVKPIVKAGETTTVCCGEPVITPGKVLCNADGRNNGTCSFTLSQKICIEVPVTIGAKSYVGSPAVECGPVSEEDICNARESECIEHHKCYRSSN
jgi:hypothetical protein